ncbi:glutamate--tRNA ligase [Leptolyngbya sp. FACHB-261]|uniref:glutamate--tRNA ligase n=1 Tax=Leptolyngbya sp. FACHB-261 TaxID=2692806 RepID=UPI001689399E|nr:glutamate--tRNA ligase [Leptolyngbya sp. FACHB-261]MBD2099448.1 glutamate--tRNA ligase [Leptolyngbya sp. FACHB-261]
MTVRVRIAPSPTGNLHIGTARTAVFNWLYAHRHGGKFILRVEDTDRERSKPEYTQNILDGLQWLGLNYDEGPFFQTERMERYQAAIQQLLERGQAYYCYTSEAELDEMREAQKARGEAPRYDNRHRHLTPEQRAEFEAQGRKPVIRFKIEEPQEISWNDLVRGPVTWNSRDLGGDMVVARSSDDGSPGQPLYNLAVVVDDIDMGITQIIRGEDHIGNTPKQILLYQALGASVPEFAHTPLILNAEGKKLSKRDGVTSIFDFRAMGFLPEALINYMVLLGWSPPDAQELFTLSEAATKFDLDRVNSAGARFDWTRLDWINSQYIHALSPEALVEHLIPVWQQAGYVFDPAADRSWLEQVAALVGPSLTRLPDAVEMTRYLFVPELSLDAEATAQCQQPGVAGVLEAAQAELKNIEALTPELATELLNRVTKDQGVKKGLVMRSMRAVLTRSMKGPDLLQSFILLHQHGLALPRLQEQISSSAA